MPPQEIRKYTIIGDNNNNRRMQNLQQRIIYLLAKTQTQGVSKAEAELNQLAVQAQNNNFFPNLISIIQNPDIEISVKVSACTYMNTCISDNLGELTANIYVEYLRALLFSRYVLPTHKRLFERAIVSIIDELAEPELTEFREDIYKLLNDQNLRDAGYLLIGCFCVPESVQNQHIIYIANMFLFSFSKIVLPNVSQAMGLVFECNEILKTWIVLWDRLYKQEKSLQQSRKKQTKKGKNKSTLPPIDSLPQTAFLLNLMEMDSFSSTIMSIYSWLAQPPLYICTVPNLYEINILKHQASELHERALYLSHKKNVDTKIYLNSLGMINNIVNNLIFVNVSRDNIDKFQCRDFATNLIKILRYIMVCGPSHFKNLWKSIIKEVLLYMIRPSQEEIQLFEQTPVDYLTLIEDCAERQTYGILKTQACKMIDKIGDKSEEITQTEFIPDFMVNFCVDSIKNYFNVNTKNVYEMEYVKLDVAITVISIFSYRLDSHKPKLSQLRELFSKQKLPKMQPYQRSLIMFFLSFNYSQVYPNPQQGSHWISHVLSQPQHQTEQHISNDFLFNISDEFYSDYFIQQLFPKILTNKSPTIWDSIQKVIRTQCQKISQALMLELIEKVYQRIGIEINGQDVQVKEEKDQGEMEVKETISVIKLVNIVAAVAENREYCLENTNVRSQIWKIGGILGHAVKYKYEDQIFEIFYQLLKQEQVLSNTSLQMLPTVLQYFTEDQYYQPYFYYILNQYLTKCPNPHLQECVTLILGSLLNGVIYHTMQLGQKLKKGQRRLISSHLLLLLQNLLYLHSGLVTNEKIVEISAIVFRYLPMDMEDKIDCHVVLARALNVLLFCHMVVRTDCVWGYVRKYAQMSCYLGYDIRVLIAIVRKDMFAEPDLAVIAEMIAILTVAISNFKKKLKLDTKAKKIQQKLGSKNRLKLLKYKQFEQLLKKMQTPFQSQKKLQSQLSSLLQTLKQCSPQNYTKMWKEYLSQQTKQLISQLCNPQQKQSAQPARRQIFTILRPKIPSAVEHEDKEDKEEKDEEGMGSDDDDDDEDFKRKRMENKRKDKQRGKNGKNGNRNTGDIDQEK